MLVVVSNSKLTRNILEIIGNQCQTMVVQIQKSKNLFTIFLIDIICYFATVGKEDPVDLYFFHADYKQKLLKIKLSSTYQL